MEAQNTAAQEEAKAAAQETAQPANGAQTAAPQQPDPANLIQGLEAQVKEKEAKYLYLYAEFENFKKRAQKERADLIKFGWEGVATDLLQVVDNLERGVNYMPPTVDKTFADGIKMVLSQFVNAMSRQGVQPIDCLDKTFDPNMHEAVGAEPSERPEGTVIREQIRGYTLHGRLLRPARVIVSEGKK